MTMTRFGRDRTPLEFQLTDQELGSIKSLVSSKAIKPLLAGTAADVIATTSAYKKAIDLLDLQLQLDRKKAEAIRANRDLAALEGELVAADQLRRELAAAKAARDAAAEGERQARRLLEIEMAKEATAIHAAPTGR